MIKLINYYLFSVPVSFEISKVHIPYSRHIIIEIEVDGKKRVGEGISYKSSLSEIEKYIPEINFEKIDWIKLIEKEPGLAAAIDQALVVGTSRDLSLQNNNNDYTKQVFIMPVDKMVGKISKLVDDGCNEIKLKLGRRVEDDIKLIKILANKFPNINFKADVNCGYDEKQFRQVLDANKGFITIWEEPVKKAYQRFLLDLKNKYKIKIMLDESVKTIDELNYYINEKIIDILNIKLSRVGGVSKAMEYVEICQKNNIQLSVGCSEELGVGMIAINYLASRINNVFGVEGIGAERLCFDILEGGGLFSRKKLYQAGQKFKFKIFEKESKHTFIDRVFEIKENYLAKFNNLLVKLKIL